MPEQQKVAQDFAMSEFSLTLVLRKEDKQNSNMTWQRYNNTSLKIQQLYSFQLLTYTIARFG